MSHRFSTNTLPLDADVPVPPIAHARFNVGDVLRHRLFDFRGVVFDIDPVFANTDEWYDAIPEDVRPRKAGAAREGRVRLCDASDSVNLMGHRK